MLLNASHKITLSGLPDDVLDAYVRYKKGTRAIVNWLTKVQNGPPRLKALRSLPLKEMALLAQIVSHQGTALPDIIHFHFRETIAARRLLTKHFRKQVDESPEDIDTVNHEHFTTRYANIHVGKLLLKRIAWNASTQTCAVVATNQNSSSYSNG